MKVVEALHRLLTHHRVVQELQDQLRRPHTHQAALRVVREPHNLLLSPAKQRVPLRAVLGHHSPLFNPVKHQVTPKAVLVLHNSLLGLPKHQAARKPLRFHHRVHHQQLIPLQLIPILQTVPHNQRVPRSIVAQLRSRVLRAFHPHVLRFTPRCIPQCLHQQPRFL
jgi:hypothetical protein